MNIMDHVHQGRVIAIVRGLKTEYMLRLAQAFKEGGIGMMEVTFNQKAPET